MSGRSGQQCYILSASGVTGRRSTGSRRRCSTRRPAMFPAMICPADIQIQPAPRIADSPRADTGRGQPGRPDLRHRAGAGQLEHPVPGDTVRGQALPAVLVRDLIHPVADRVERPHLVPAAVRPPVDHLRARRCRSPAHVQQQTERVVRRHIHGERGTRVRLPRTQRQQTGRCSSDPSRGQTPPHPTDAPSPFPVPLRKTRRITFITITFPLTMCQTDPMSAAVNNSENPAGHAKGCPPVPATVKPAPPQRLTRDQCHTNAPALHAQRKAARQPCANCLSANNRVKDRRVVMVRDMPIAGMPARLRWRRRVFECRYVLCPNKTFTEGTTRSAPRAVLTDRARQWAFEQVGHHDRAVCAVADQFGGAGRTIGQRARRPTGRQH